MALTGYPKTFDHPKMAIIYEGQSTTGNIAYIKSFGDDSTDWIEYIVMCPNSNKPKEELITLRVNVGASLHGPFTSVKHNDEGGAGGPSGSQECYTQIFETEI